MGCRHKGKMIFFEESVRWPSRGQVNCGHDHHYGPRRTIITPSCPGQAGWNPRPRIKARDLRFLISGQPGMGGLKTLGQGGKAVNVF